ncbi:unnamed protein product [Lepeophtheirus salmonis]|uniref:(salmon louse) hypothetical protein n=1 Tax=Lepeophtheirus salmonis TaxID=72036 RepID=A0A7R8HA64_LEPSM|nr:unnamed protein product [Lepeophtheirus salmonis]CAF2951800.1 unnamed protein product [Lepeophtheirus salmonis]
MSLLNSINSVTTTMNTTTNHLLNLLLHLQQSHTPPYPENKGVIFLYLSLTPICFELTEEGDLEGTVWYHWKWEDSRLKWIDDTSNEVLVPKRLIHIPGILPISKYVRETFDHRELATIYRNGTVFLNQRVRIKVPCDGYTWDNPWDIMNCSFTYTPWTHNSATIDLRKLGETDSVDLSKYDNENCPVKLINVSVPSTKKLIPSIYLWKLLRYIFQISEENGIIKLIALSVSFTEIATERLLEMVRSNKSPTLSTVHGFRGKIVFLVLIKCGISQLTHISSWEKRGLGKVLMRFPFSSTIPSSLYI